MEETIDREQIRNAFQAIILNSLINNYAVERVAFGYEKPGDIVPIELYLKDLGMDIGELHSRQDIPGVYIDMEERISTEQDYDEYVRDLFVIQMETVLVDAPKDKSLERTGDEIPFISQLRDYLFGILPLFAEVINVKTERDVLDVFPTPEEFVTEYPKWRNFVSAILYKAIIGGGQIDMCVEDFAYAPHYIDRLIEKKDGRLCLKPVEKESYEFKFAVFSVMQFMNVDHNRILEQKMLEWERLHRSK